MGELSEAYRRSLRNIDELYLKALKWEKQKFDEEKEKNISRLKQLGLKESEANAWLKNELKFTKRVTKPIQSKRRRDARTLAIVLLLATSIILAQAQTVKAASPNGLPHPHLPNVNDALPELAFFIIVSYDR